MPAGSIVMTTSIFSICNWGTNMFSGISTKRNIRSFRLGGEEMLVYLPKIQWIYLEDEECCKKK